MKGKAIYNPSGKAGEYSYWACNLFKGCSGRCTYCYLKKGITANVLGGDTPVLKACFKNEPHAKQVFVKEMKDNKAQLQEHGLFFSFTSDFLPQTTDLLKYCIDMCILNYIPVKVLTKQVDWITPDLMDYWKGSEIAFGFTLTGHDEEEPGCARNYERIQSMKYVKLHGFKTFASIEPIIDIESSFLMITSSKHVCDLYKIGLQSGKKYVKKE